MCSLRLHKFVFAGALLALVPFVSRAQDAKKAEPIPAPHHPPAVAPAPSGDCAPAPQTCKVRVCEMVQETREVVKTTYKHECREECYTAYKCETVREQKTRQVTCYKRVCETVMVPKTVCKKVPCWETKTVMETKCRLERVTEYKSKCVDHGHWECKEVPCGPSIGERLFRKKDCCDPCANDCCPRTKTVKCWVSCMVNECVPVCRTKLVKECVPVCKQVCTYKTETHCEMVPCTKWKCVPECKTETYWECKTVKVPYQAKRTVSVCVPCQEKCQVTVCVPRWVEKEVPCCPAPTCCPTTSCCEPCADTCCSGGWFSKLRARWGKKSDCCDSGCHSDCGGKSSCCY